MIPLLIKLLVNVIAKNMQLVANARAAKMAIINLHQQILMVVLNVTAILLVRFVIVLHAIYFQASVIAKVMSSELNVQIANQGIMDSLQIILKDVLVVIVIQLAQIWGYFVKCQQDNVLVNRSLKEELVTDVSRVTMVLHANHVHVMLLVLNQV